MSSYRDHCSAGSVGILRVDMQGVQALRSNDAVDALYIYLTPASMEVWAREQSLRQGCSANLPMVVALLSEVARFVKLMRSTFC